MASVRKIIIYLVQHVSAKCHQIMTPFSVKFSHVVIQSFLLTQCPWKQITFLSENMWSIVTGKKFVIRCTNTEAGLCLIPMSFSAILGRVIRLAWSNFAEVILAGFKGRVDRHVNEDLWAKKSIWESEAEWTERRTNFPSVAAVPQRTKPLALSMFAAKFSRLKLGQTFQFSLKSIVLKLKMTA